MALRADDPRLHGFDEGWWDAFEPPEGLRAEIVGGELVLTPSPGATHAFVATKLTVLLQAAVPDGLIVAQNLEWRTARSGRVASAPIPDLVVVPTGIEALTDPPLLAVEILSNSDRQRHATGQTRIEVKREDYAAAGLQHYLEVDSTGAGVTMVTRFVLDRGRLEAVESAIGDEILSVDTPFLYRIKPAAL